MSPWAKALAATVASALAAMLTAELVRIVRDRYAVDLEVRARGAVDNLVRRRRIDTAVRRDAGAVIWEAMQAIDEHEAGR